MAYIGERGYKELGRNGEKVKRTRKRRTTDNGDGKMKKVLVSLPEGILKLIRELKGKFGESDSEVVRTIVISFLSEKGYLSKREKP